MMPTSIFTKIKDSTPNMESLYQMEDQLTFIVQTNSGFYNCQIAWEQGSGNNYRFVIGDSLSYSDDQIIWPENVLSVYLSSSFTEFSTEYFKDKKCLFIKKDKTSLPNMDFIYSSEHSSFYVVNEKGVFVCEIAWEQGRGNNYRFVIGDSLSYSDKQIIWPEDVISIWI